MKKSLILIKMIYVFIFFQALSLEFKYLAEFVILIRFKKIDTNVRENDILFRRIMTN